LKSRHLNNKKPEQSRHLIKQNMKDEKIKATAKVRVLLEIKISSTWGEDCTVKQVHKQAVDSAELIINQAFGSNSGIKLSGSPKVEAIILPER
jgi:hypothetical protein